MIAFGQGISVTPLQLVSAVSALANQGQMVKPHLVKKIESTDGRFVKLYTGEGRGTALSPATVKEMKKLLRNVVLFGSGRRAQMASFTVGGKTGTAQKALGGRYVKGRYVASFIGLAPLSNPELITLVIVDEPKGSIWGESVCGPVFKDVTEYSLRYLNAQPDML
jgi:stage V sporulation protein D (sporulation-specific penicillin-binding protein)